MARSDPIPPGAVGAEVGPYSPGASYALTEIPDDTISVGAAAPGALVVDREVEHGESRQRAERHRRWTEATYDLLDIVTPPIESRTALTQIARVARGVAGSAGAFIIAADAEAIAADGPAADEWGRERLAALVAEAQWRLVRQPVDMPGWTATTTILPTHLLRQCVLALVFPPGVNPPAGDELVELSSFAHFAALVLDRAKGLEYGAEMALQRERNRIATDLHDSVIQELFSLGLQMQAIEMTAAGTAGRERLTRAIEAVDRAIASLRSTIAAIEGSAPEAGAGPPNLRRMS